MIIEIKANGVVLPSPVSISVNDEIIWSSDTGRTLSGEMVGDIVATKDTVSIQWAWLTNNEMNTIHNAIHNGKFFPLVIEAIGIDITAYRGAITKSPRNVGTDVFYESASVDFIAR